MKELIRDMGEDEPMRLLKQVMEKNEIIINLQKQVLELQKVERQKRRREQERKWRKREYNER